MRFLATVFLVVVACIGTGCGQLFPSSRPVYQPAPSPERYSGYSVERSSWARRTARCAGRASGIALLHGGDAIPLRAEEAASVKAMLTSWYWTELRSFTKRSASLAAEFTTLTPSSLSVSVSSGTATFFLDGYRLKNGRLVSASGLRNGRPDRGEASLLDVTGSSNAQVPIPDLGSHAGRSLDFTSSRARCVPERTASEQSAVSAALSALSIATRD